MKLFNLINIVLFILLQNISFGQWKVVSKIERIITERYSIINDDYKPIKGYYFPSNFVDSDLYKCYKPLKKTRNHQILSIDFGNYPSWIKKLNTPINCYLDSTLIYMNYRCVNIDKFTIYIRSGISQKWYFKEFTVPYDGLQMPVMTRLSEFNLFTKNDSLRASNKYLGKNCTENTLTQFILTVKPKNKEYDLSIGNFVIGNRAVVNVPIHHPFFDPITGENSLELLSSNSLENNLFIPYIISSYDYYSSFGHSNSEFYLIPDSINYDKKEIMLALFQQIFKYYGFYTERNIDSNEVLNKYNSFKKLKYPDLLDSLKSLVSNFHDPHFFIPDNDNGENKKIMAPLNLYEFNNKILVAAIFDSTLNRRVSLGDKVIRIDGRSVDGLIDTLSLLYKGTYESRREKAIGNILKRKWNDSCLVQLVNAKGDTLTEALKYNKKLIIPDNFIPRHCELRQYTNNILYFRINNFSLDVWSKFLNTTELLKHARGLIIDIRNNGGGDGGTVFKLISLFINSPAIVSYSYLSSFRDHKESLVVYPNKLFHFDLPITILVNNGTACASELFAYTMKLNNKSILIGDSKTAGTLSNRYTIILPDNYKIYINCLTNVVCYPEYKIETNGISPDIWTWNNKINELYPYDDKTLKTALKLLNQNNNENVISSRNESGHKIQK